MMFKKLSLGRIALEYAVAVALCAACQFFKLSANGSAAVNNAALGLGLFVLFVASLRKTSLGVSAALAAGCAMALFSLITAQPQILLYALVYFVADGLVPVLLMVFRSYSSYLKVIWTVMARFVFLWVFAALVYKRPLILGPSIVGWSELVLSLLAGFIAILAQMWLSRRFPAK